MSMDCKTCLENGGPPLTARDTGKCNYCDMACPHAPQPEANDRQKALNKLHRKMKALRGLGG